MASFFHSHTAYRMPLISSSKDGRWSCGEECHEQHLTFARKGPDGLNSNCSVVTVMGGDGGQGW